MNNSGKTTEEIERDLLKQSKQQNRATPDNRVDEAIAESFPASDPPSWTAGVKRKQ